MTENYNILINKLNSFIRKYYLNNMLRGLIWFVAVSAFFFVLINLFEYYSWSSSNMRTLLFFLYLAVNGFILASLVIIPLLKLFRIGHVLDEEQAAKIIGDHFPEVKDKLLNTIQLKKLSEKNGTAALLQASIDQKTSTLHPVPFLRAIDLRKNRKYLKFALPPLLLILVLFFSSPSTITEPSKRLINYSTEFERPLPFNLVILNKDLTGVQQEDLTIMVKAEGEVMPASVMLAVNNSLLPFEKHESGEFHYTLNNLHQDMQFSLQAESYSFGPYYIRVLPKPIIINYEVAIDYPSYTGKKDEVFENTGDFVVPEGSKVSWNFITRDTEKLVFRTEDRSLRLESGASNAYKHSMRINEDLYYSVSVANEHLSNPDSLAYSITAIPDMYPSVLIEEFRDSVYEKMLYFRGQISDDYGFSKLQFSYEFLNHFDTARIEGEVYREDVAISAGLPKQMIFHHFNLDRLNIRPGDEIAYFFEVWDNDAVNGAKSSKSHRMIFRAPTLEEVSEQTKADNNEIMDEMEDIIDESRMLQKQIEKLNKQLINKESLNWQDKEQIKNLLDQQQQLQQRMELLEKKNQEKMSREEEYKQLDESILEKHRQLQELFDQVMDDEMKKLFEELQKLLDELRKEDVNEMLEKMEMSAAEIEQELDKNLELFKQLEFEKKLTETIDKLNELAEKQEKLAEKTENKEADGEELGQEQQELNEEFESIREDMDELDNMNEELEQKHKMEDTESQEEQIQQDMENSLEEIEKGKNKKAAGSQQNAQQQMKKMAEQMLQMQMAMMQQSNAEDIRTLREILENLLVISFDQEDLITDLGLTNPTDPQYQRIIERQHEVEDNMKVVEDSLYALSKRQIAIQPFVNKEVDKIKKNIEDAYERLEERKKGDAATSQQYVMTSVNNLALLLSEALNQLQQQSNMDMPGNASCNNPGSGKPGQMPQNMSQMQKMLNQQMQKLKSGQQGTQGKRSLSEQFARMAAEQEAIRRQMQQYLEELKSQGETGDAGMNQLMEEMEKTELDLVNKQLTEETLKRQEDILTRLLKHEKAAREREKEERRESTEAKMQDYSNPGDFLEYKRLLLKEVELLKTVPPNLKPFYKRKVNEYFYNFGN
jgi:hypothetical protein